MTLLRDFRGQVSWGRVCALVALVMAVRREFQGADIQHVALWLLTATGSYGTSKLTEIVALFKGNVPPTPLAQPSAPMGASNVEASTAPGGAGLVSGDGTSDGGNRV